MINMKFRKALFFGLAVLSYNSSAATYVNKEVLAKQCRELAFNVTSLVADQQQKTCTEKLAIASMKFESAGALILKAAASNAKQQLNEAAYLLQYAELSNCNKYIQIAHAKFEAQRIKNSL